MTEIGSASPGRPLSSTVSVSKREPLPIVTGVKASALWLSESGVGRRVGRQGDDEPHDRERCDEVQRTVERAVEILVASPRPVMESAPAVTSRSPVSLPFSPAPGRESRQVPVSKLHAVGSQALPAGQLARRPR